MRKILVTGATGHQGGAVARQLLKSGTPIRVLTRRPEGPASRELAHLGAEITQGDFDDGESLRRALEGIEGVFAMGVPEEGVEKEVSRGIRLAEAAREARVSHYIYSSVISADRRTGIPFFESKAKIERHIRGMGIPFTVIAPAYFMENLLASRSEILSSGILKSGLPPLRSLQQVSLSTLAEFVELAFHRPDHFLQRRFEVASDEVSGFEMSRILSQVLQRPVHYSQISLVELEMSSQPLARMYRWLNEVGSSVDLEGLRTTYRAVKWLRFEDWARQQSWNPQSEIAAA